MAKKQSIRREQPALGKTRQYTPDEVNKRGEYIKIGGSPVPGITLRQVLGESTAQINHIAWSPDAKYLSSSSIDKTISIWDHMKESCLVKLQETNHRINTVAWSPNSRWLASDHFSAVRVWDVESWQPHHRLKGKANNEIGTIAWSPDGKKLSASSMNNLYIWDAETWELLKNSNKRNSPTWSSDSNWVALNDNEDTIHIWDANTYSEVKKLKHYPDRINNMAWMPNQTIIASCSNNRTILIWDTQADTPTHILEGHTGSVYRLSFSGDGILLASKAEDGIRIWRTDTWEMVASLHERASNWLPCLAFHPHLPRFASLGEGNKFIKIWDIDYNILLGAKGTTTSIRYTTAKLVLVGDSGVGKTGLGWRLAHNEFKEHSSTHGQQFWVIPELGKKRDDGTECEAVLWDLAGQPDYRLVHSLYLDDVDTAMILFDPTKRQEPLSGVDFWLNQLKDENKKLRNSILIGARIDRGTTTLTNYELQAYCDRNKISGGYIPTSAKKGDGLSELLEKLKNQIPWDQMTATVTTVTFKKIKEYVLALKEKTHRKNVLVTPAELRQQLHVIDKDWEFSDAEMMTAVGHLETHGYVKVIHSSKGEHSILLAPDILANLASSIVLEARRNPHGLGVLEEAKLLRGDYPFQELNNLSEGEGNILLDAAAVLFLERNVCFRETFNQQTFLVFPSLINEKRPTDETIKTEEGASYRVEGAVENIYASLVVLLGYTNTFIRTQQWQNQAQYELGEGEICGFHQTDYGDGGIELVLYYGENTPESVRIMFRGLFERFLGRRELYISRYQPVRCKRCGTLLARNVVLDQLNKGKNVSYCHECGERALLPSPEPLTRLSPKEEIDLDAQQAIAKYRTAFEAALVRVKALLRDQGEEKKPSCFISYAWGVSKNERWVLQLAKDLQKADIDVLLDRWHSPPGSNLDLYIDRILSSDFVIPVGTPELRQKYDTKTDDPVVAAELKLINLRVRQTTEYGETVLPVLLTGTAKTSLTPQLQPLVSVDFRKKENYFRKLFDMIWRLYNLSFDNPILVELQASMTPQKR